MQIFWGCLGLKVYKRVNAWCYHFDFTYLCVCAVLLLRTVYVCALCSLYLQSIVDFGQSRQVENGYLARAIL